MRYLVNIAYDGLFFIGSQKQSVGRTIQGEFEKLLSKLFNEEIKVVICSRLDAKVSAKDFVFTFDTNNKSNISISHIKKFLQDSFGTELLIKDIYLVKDDFHPRYNVKYKIYSYRIENTSNFDPLTSSHSLIIKTPLNIKKIKEGIKLFIGCHNFVYFTKDVEAKNTNLCIDKIWLKKDRKFIYIKFKGKSFLKYQIRFIVGALIMFSEGKISKEDIVNALEGETSSTYIKKKVDGNGLVLEKVEFTKGYKL